MLFSVTGLKVKTGETLSGHKCVKTEVDPGELLTNRNSDSVSQLVSFRYLQKVRLHAAESEMISSRIDLALAARAHDVTGAILLVAEEGTAFVDALFLRRLRGIKGALRALRVSRDAALLRKSLKVIGIPIAAPLPDVPGHVIEVVAIWGKRFHGRNTGKSILACLLNRKLSLIGVCHKFPARF